MKKILFALLFLTTGFLACDTKVYDDFPPCTDCIDFAKLNKEDGQAYLNAWYKKLSDAATNETCTDPNEFKIVPIGSKACGGPTGYIAFRKIPNNQPYFEEVERYTKTQEAFNKKWGVVSDCSIVNPPKGLECVNGKPKFIN